MTPATAILRKEHEAILKMLEVTTEVTRELEAGEPVPAQTLTDLLEFFRVFADRCHHGKEEDLLFPLLTKKGLPPVGGPIMVMLSEHVQGRAYIKQMSDAAEAYARGVPNSGVSWALAARYYTRLLRDHIDKENNVLFNMAEHLLNAIEQRELAAQFDKIELQKIGAGTHERLHAKMDELFNTYLARVTIR